MLNKEKQQAIEVLLKWGKNVNAGNIDGVMGLFADDSILLPTFSSKILSSKSDIKAYFLMLAARPGARVDIDVATVVVTEAVESTVSIVGNYTFYFEEAGELVAYPSRFTFVVRLNADQPIAHQHSSVVPVA